MSYRSDSSPEQAARLLLNGLRGHSHGERDDALFHGYGTKRILVTSTESAQICPFNFTASGFCSPNGCLWLCLRMNVDQNSPEKRRSWDGRENPFIKIGEMMNEFIKELLVKKGWIKEEVEQKVYPELFADRHVCGRLASHITVRPGVCDRHGLYEN